MITKQHKAPMIPKIDLYQLFNDPREVLFQCNFSYSVTSHTIPESYAWSTIFVLYFHITLLLFWNTTDDYHFCPSNGTPGKINENQMFVIALMS